MSRIKDALKERKKHKEKLLTPHIIEFMATRQLFKFDDAAIKIAEDILKSERIERREDVFHPSGSAACMRGQVLNMNGHRPEKEVDIILENIFDDGKWRHLRWHLILYRMGISHSVEPFISQKTLKRVGGSPDQVLNLSKLYPWLAGKRVGFEMKGAREYKFKHEVVANKRPFISHIFQIVVYMILLKLDLYVVLYEDKNNQEFYEIDVALNHDYDDKIKDVLVLDPLWVEYITKRYIYMNGALDMGALPAHECEMDPDDVQFKRCQYSKACAKSKLKTLKPFPDKKIVERKLFENVSGNHEGRVADFSRLLLKERAE